MTRSADPAPVVITKIEEPPPVAVVAPPPVALPEPVVEALPAVADAGTRAPVAQPLARLTGKDIGKVFTKSQKQLRGCLENNRKLLPSKEGEMMMTFTVLDSGVVSTAKVTSPGFEGVIGECVASRLKSLKFPRHREPAVTFALPLAYVFKD